MPCHREKSPEGHPLLLGGCRPVPKEQGARSKEQGARSKEQGARSKEQGARSKEQDKTLNLCEPTTKKGRLKSLPSILTIKLMLYRLAFKLQLEV
jgi:hypothetical protein